MTTLFKKLQFKAHNSILAINYPPSFAPELDEMAKESTIVKELKESKELSFVICFVTKENEIKNFVSTIYSYLKGDAILWICYPKASSKNYTCDFNRDNGWAIMGQFNLEPVRQVAIDADWSALRFRKVEYIKTITRRESFALTAEAKKRTTQKGK